MPSLASDRRRRLAGALTPAAACCARSCPRTAAARRRARSAASATRAALPERRAPAPRTRGARRPAPRTPPAVRRRLRGPPCLASGRRRQPPCSCPHTCPRLLLRSWPRSCKPTGEICSIDDGDTCCEPGTGCVTYAGEAYPRCQTCEAMGSACGFPASIYPCCDPTAECAAPSPTAQKTCQLKPICYSTGQPCSVGVLDCCAQIAKCVPANPAVLGDVCAAPPTPGTPADIASTWDIDSISVVVARSPDFGGSTFDYRVRVTLTPSPVEIPAIVVTKTIAADPSAPDHTVLFKSGQPVDGGAPGGGGGTGRGRRRRLRCLHPAPAPAARVRTQRRRAQARRPAARRRPAHAPQMAPWRPRCAAGTGGCRWSG